MNTVVRTFVITFMRSIIPMDINLNVTADVLADVHVAKLLYVCASGIISETGGIRSPRVASK